MSTFVNVWPGRWRGTDRAVSTLVSTKWADLGGGVGPSSRGGSRTIFTQLKCVSLTRYAARYALLVRTLALVLGQFAPVVRTTGSQPLCANLGGLPVIKSYGFQVEVSTVVSTVLQVPGDPHAAVNGQMKTTMPAAQCQPIRSQVFSGSAR